MKSKKFKNLITLFALLATLSVLSSCNRGVGCPNNFSLSENVSTVIKALPQAATAILK